MRVMLACGLGVMLTSCLLEDAPPSRSLQGESLIAIVAEPAEAMPGERVRYRAVVASPEGPIEAAASWAFCSTPRPLSQNAAVSVACASTEELPIDASATEVAATIPMDACARFGPETSAGFRPTDPDQSGGYYQPVRAALDGVATIHRQRVRCALPDAPFEVVRSFQRDYQTNRAPAVIALSAESEVLKAGATVALSLSLAADAVETYVFYDRARGRLVERTETLKVRWYVSAGALQRDTSVPTAGRASVRWQTPQTFGSAWVWAVVSDERGGVSARVQRFTPE